MTFYYFYIDYNYFYHIKATAVSTTRAVVYANLHVASQEVQMFENLPDIYSSDIVEVFIRKYLRFFDDVNYIWKQKFDTKTLRSLLNSLDSNTQFFIENLS